MPKRKKSENLEENLSTLLRKVRKLEKKIKKRNRISSSDSNHSEKDAPDVETPQATPEVFTLEADDSVTPSTLEANIEADPNRDIVQIEQEDVDCCQNNSITLAPNLDNPEPPTDASADNVDILDNDVLEILGLDPDTNVKYGADVRQELASRLQHWATEGLTKDCRKELTDKYLLPSNCLKIGAPNINAKIKAAIQASILNRDKGIEAKQKQIGSAISCLAGVINSQMLQKDKNNDLLQKLTDAVRLLCDVQHSDSATRRNFILFSLKKDITEPLSKTKIDSYLFGENLPDTIKTAKALQTTGYELKSTVTAKNTPKRPISNRQRPQKQLNRKAVPVRRQPGPATYTAHSRPPAAAWQTTWPQQSFLPPPPPPPPAAGPSLRTSSRHPAPQTRRKPY